MAKSASNGKRRNIAVAEDAPLPITAGATIRRRRPKVAAANPAPDLASTPRTSKQDIVLRLLRQEQGASIEELMTATGWQKHSVRGFMSGTVKTKLDLDLTSEKTERGRVYRILDSAPATEGLAVAAANEVDHAG